MELYSPAFADGAPIPDRFTCEGQGLSPPLSWRGIPGDAESLALFCDDPDAPGGRYRHWGVFDIPPRWDGLPAGFRGGRPIRQTLSDNGRLGYAPPCPPPGSGRHRYVFVLLALRCGTLSLPDGVRFEEAERAAFHSDYLARSSLTGVFARRSLRNPAVHQPLGE